MAQIELKILAADADDLQQTLAALGAMADPVRYEDGEVDLEVVEAPQDVKAYADVEDAPDVEAPKKGRGRPKKADANGSGDPTPQPQADAGAATSSEPSLEEELFAAEADEEAVTFDQMQTVGRAYFVKHGADATAKRLGELANGAQAFKQVAPEFYAVVHRTLGAEL